MSIEALSTDDHVEIAALYSRYCEYLDFNRATEWAELFVPDGRFAVRGPERTGGALVYEVIGREALVQFATEAYGRRAGLARHWVTGVRADLRGDAVHGFCNTMLLATDPETKQVSIVVSGSHDDLLVKTEDGWRFIEQVTVGVA